MFAAILFFLFSFMILGSALLVISSKNPVNSVIFLIFSFFNSAAIFLIAGAEFLALIMLIVYVGAVAVLFLFVVMMLDLNYEDVKSKVRGYRKTGYFIGTILAVEITLLFLYDSSSQSLLINENNNQTELTNTEMIGLVIYTDHFFHFQISGLILLVAMIGAIVLTVRKRPNVKRQNISDQVSVRVDDVIEVKDVTSGSGI